MTTNNDHIQTLKQMRDDWIKFVELYKDSILSLIAQKNVDALDRSVESLSSPWKSIETDGLPGKSGIYWTTDPKGLVRKNAFYVGAFQHSAIAWMPDEQPEPYLPTENKQ